MKNFEQIFFFLRKIYINLLIFIFKKFFQWKHEAKRRKIHKIERDNPKKHLIKSQLKT